MSWEEVIKLDNSKSSLVFKKKVLNEMIILLEIAESGDSNKNKILELTDRLNRIIDVLKKRD